MEHHHPAQNAPVFQPQQSRISWLLALVYSSGAEYFSCRMWQLRYYAVLECDTKWSFSLPFLSSYTSLWYHTLELLRLECLKKNRNEQVVQLEISRESLVKRLWKILGMMISRALMISKFWLRINFVLRIFRHLQFSVRLCFWFLPLCFQLTQCNWELSQFHRVRFLQFYQS